MVSVVAGIPSDFTASAADTTATQVWTLIVAGLAVVATLVSAYLLRRTGRGTVSAAQRAADASERSARAAQEAVGVNRETAAGVARRAEDGALAARYQDAATQLGHDKAPVRLAGVYAMARLADDWSAQRQVCVDVLCAYLRMPWPSEGDAVRSSDGKVREAILSVTSSHLRGDRDVPDWKTLNFDFSGAVFRSIRLYNIAFASVSNFTGARFEGMNTFERCTFLQGANFDHCSIEGRLFLDDIAVAGNQMVSKGGELLCFTLDKAHVGEYGELIIRPAAITESGQIFGYDTRVDGLLCIDSREMRAPCGTIIFNGFKLGAASKLMINKAPMPHRGFNPAAKFVYPRISFIYPDVERGASVELDEALVKSGSITGIKAQARREDE